MLGSQFDRGHVSSSRRIKQSGRISRTPLLLKLIESAGDGRSNPALKLTIDAFHRYNGYLVQSTNDGIFALFGAPVATRSKAVAIKIEPGWIRLRRHLHT